MTTSYPIEPSSVSGVFVKHLCDALEALGKFELTIVTPSYQVVERDNSSVKFVRYAPKELENIAHSPGGLPAALNRSKWNLVWLISMFLMLFLSGFNLAKKSDVLHAHWSLSGVLLVFWSCVFRRKLVVTLRGQDVNLAKKKKVFKILLDIVIRYADVVVCVSQNQVDYLRNSYSFAVKKIILIPNGVEKVFFEIGSRRKKLNFKKKKKIKLLTSSSLIPIKKNEVLIRSLLFLDKKFELVLLGDGPERMNLERLVAELKLQDRVLFTGQMTGNEKLNYWEDADIFVFASESEGRPNVLYEAYASRLPAVVSDIPGNREIMGVEALYFPVGNVDKLVENIMTIEEQSVQKKQHFEQDQLFNELLSWRQSAERHSKLYFDMLQRRVTE